MSEAAEKPDSEKPAKPEKTPQQKRMELFCNITLFVRGVFHAAFTFAVYFAWAAVVDHIIPPEEPLEFAALMAVTVVTFFGWVSGIDIITGHLEPFNLAQHPVASKRIIGKSDKTEHKKA